MGVLSSTGKLQRQGDFSRQRGFTLFELVVVVCVISIIGFVALGFYHKLLVDVERTTLKQNIGNIQSAVAMEFASLYAAGNTAGMKQLAQVNPVSLLEQPPANYLGELDGPSLESLETGSWHFDTATRRLVYLVLNRDFFMTELPGTPRAEFYLTGTSESAGLNVPIVQSVVPYQWRSPWK